MTFPKVFMMEVHRCFLRQYFFANGRYIDITDEEQSTKAKEKKQAFDFELRESMNIHNYLSSLR